MTYTCKYCERQFSRKCYYERHEPGCGLMYKTSDERRLELEEHGDTPSQRKLYEMVLALASIVKKQEQKINKLESIIQRTQREKLSVIKWLDDNAKPVQSFDVWVQSMKFDESDLNCMFQNGHIKGLCTVITQRIDNDSINTLPVRSFKQKQHTLYQYTGEKWELMSPEKLTNLVNFVYKAIGNNFAKWSEDNMEKIDNVLSDFSTEWMEKINIVKGPLSMTSEKRHTSIKKALYEHLKYDLQNVVEYEFTF